MSYKYEMTDEATEDMENFNNSQKQIIFNSMDRVVLNPLPKNEGGYGKPLGNKGGHNLTGLLKIKFVQLGVRVVYQLIRTDEIMKIIVVSLRSDNEVYNIAAKRMGR